MHIREIDRHTTIMTGAVDQIIFTFNKFFYDLVKDLKSSNIGLKNQIKKHYTVKNNESRDHFELIEKELGTEDVIKCLVSSPLDQVFTFGQLTKVHILIDLDINDILLQIPVDFKDPFLGYIYLFAILILVSRDEVHEVHTDLFMAVMHTINAIQKKEPFDHLIDDILDDDISALLVNFEKCQKAVVDATAPSSMPSMPKGMESMEGLMENSQIGSIAKEIASSIDVSKINPEDMLSGANGNMIGDLVSKVGTRLQEKFNDGSMNQEDLVKEAMSMMSMIGGGKNGGFMGELFKNLNVGGSGNGSGKGLGGGSGNNSGARQHKKKLTKS